MLNEKPIVEPFWMKVSGFYFKTADDHVCCSIVLGLMVVVLYTSKCHNRHVESRTQVNGKRLQAAIFSRSHVNGKKLQVIFFTPL